MDVFPNFVEDSVDVATEFDWRDYDYEDDMPVPDPLGSDEEYEEWNKFISNKKEEVLQLEESTLSTSDVSSSTDNKSQRPGTPAPKHSRKRTPPRVHFKKSMEDIFYKHSKPHNEKSTGILKNKGYSSKSPEELPPLVPQDKSPLINTENKEKTDIDHDLSDAIRQFDKYISEKVVCFAKQKGSKIKYLWSNLDVENSAQWEKEGTKKLGDKKTGQYEPNTDISSGNGKGEFRLPLIKYSRNQKSIHDFEKRNVTRTITKLSSIESLFVKCKPLTPDSTIISDDELDIGNQYEYSMSSPRRDHSRTNRRGSLQRDPGEAITTHHGIRLKRAIRKVQKLLATEKGNKIRKTFKTFINDTENTEVPEISKMSPLERFRHAGRLTVIMLRAVGIKPEKPEDSDYNFLSWTILYDELGISRTPYDPSGLMFDPQKFKASKESSLSHDIEDILLRQPSQRTDAQIQQVIRFLSQVVPAFGEYPMRIQRSTLKCCTLERFEGGRVIIRQGHRAENFYFILSGTAVVTVMESGANHVHTVNSLTAGNSFGELAFLNMSQRTATVTCRDNMELLCIEREDFIEIFMRRIKGQEPEHMAFLRNLDVLRGWPIERLPLDNLKLCAFTYVRRGVILAPDSTKSDWLFVVVSGTCKILKSLLDLEASKEKSTTRSEILGFPKQRSRRRVQHDFKTSFDDDQSLKHHADQKSKKKHRSKLNLSPPRRQPSAIDLIVNRSKEEVRLSEEEHLNKLNSIYQKRHVLPSIHKDDKDIQQENANEEENESFGDDDSENDNTVSLLLNPRKSSHHVKFAPPLQIKPSTPSQFLRETSQNFGIQRSVKSASRRLVVSSPGASTVHAWNTEPQVKKVFIEVARLEPGDIFGLEQLVMSGREEVTSTSLVSDGAEVIIIQKKFFRKHLTEETAKRIRKMIRPMPSESALQQNFVNQKSWDAYKTKMLENQTHYMKMKASAAFRA